MDDDADEPRAEFHDVVALFSELGFDSMPPARIVTAPLREDDPAIAKRLAAARKVLRAGKQKALGTWREVVGRHGQVQFETEIPGTREKLAEALHQARPDLREHSQEWDEKAGRLCLFVIRLGVSPFQAMLLAGSDPWRPWMYSVDPERGLPYCTEVECLDDPRLRAAILETGGAEFAQKVIREDQRWTSELEETAIHLTRILQLDPPGYAVGRWVQLLTGGGEGTAALQEIGADRPLEWIRAGLGDRETAPSFLLEPLPGLREAGHLSREQALDALLMILEACRRPGQLKAAAAFLRDVEAKMPGLLLPAGAVRTRAAEFTAILQRGQADMARLLGEHLIREADEEHLPLVLSALLAVKPRNARLAVLRAGRERSQVPDGAAMQEISTLLEDLVANDGHATFVTVVRDLEEAWGGEPERTDGGAPPSRLEAIGADAREVDAALRAVRKDELDAERRARGEHLTLADRTFNQVWRVPTKPYPLLEDHVGVTLHEIDATYGMHEGSMVWGMESPWALELELPVPSRRGDHDPAWSSPEDHPRAVLVHADVNRPILYARTLELREGGIDHEHGTHRLALTWRDGGLHWQTATWRRGGWDSPGTLPGRDRPLPPVMIAALLTDWAADAKAKRDWSIEEAGRDKKGTLWALGENWRALLRTLQFDDRVLELVLRRLLTGTDASPQPFLWLLTRNHAALGVLWPLWTVMLDRAADEARATAGTDGGAGSLPRWTTQVLAQMHEGRRHLAEAIRRGLLDPERVIGTGLREIAARGGTSVSVARAREILQELEAAGAHGDEPEVRHAR